MSQHLTSLCVVWTCALALGVPARATAQQAPAPPDPEEIVLDTRTTLSPIDLGEDDAAHRVEPFMEQGLPVYRYPVVSRPAEMLLQGTGGVAASLYSFIIIDEIIVDFTDSDQLPYLAYGALAGISNALVVRGMGHTNGSRSEWTTTIAGGLIGGALGGSIVYLNDENHLDIPSDLAETAAFVLPTIGALVGYHLLSSWRTERTKKTRSIAASPLFEDLMSSE